MFPKFHSKKDKTLFIISVILFGIIGFIIGFTQSQKNSEAPTWERITIIGQQICLPHKDTSGPQTKECAFGIKTEEGKNYSINFSILSAYNPTINNSSNSNYQITGPFIPAAEISDNRLQKYDIEGEIWATSVKDLL